MRRFIEYCRKHKKDSPLVFYVFTFSIVVGAFALVYGSAARAQNTLQPPIDVGSVLQEINSRVDELEQLNTEAAAWRDRALAAEADLEVALSRATEAEAALISIRDRLNGIDVTELPSATVYGASAQYYSPETLGNRYGNYEVRVEFDVPYEETVLYAAFWRDPSGYAQKQTVVYGVDHVSVLFPFQTASAAERAAGNPGEFGILPAAVATAEGLSLMAWPRGQVYACN